MVCGARLGALELGRVSRYGILKRPRGTAQEANNARRGLIGELGALDVRVYGVRVYYLLCSMDYAKKNDACRFHISNR